MKTLETHIRAAAERPGLLPRERRAPSLAEAISGLATLWADRARRARAAAEGRTTEAERSADFARADALDVSADEALRALREAGL